MPKSLGRLESAQVVRESAAGVAPICNVDEELRCSTVCLYRAGRLEQARKALLRALEVTSSNPDLAVALAVLAADLIRQTREFPRFIAR